MSVPFWYLEKCAGVSFFRFSFLWNIIGSWAACQILALHNLPNILYCIKTVFPLSLNILILSLLSLLTLLPLPHSFLSPIPLTIPIPFYFPSLLSPQKEYLYTTKIFWKKLCAMAKTHTAGMNKIGVIFAIHTQRSYLNGNYLPVFCFKEWIDVLVS